MNTDELQPTVPAAFLYTLEYGNTVVDQKVSVYQLNYPFGVCGADYLAKNEDGVSYVRQTPLYTTLPAQPAPYVASQLVQQSRSDVEPVAWMYELIIDGEVCNVECTNVNWNPEYQPFGRSGIDFVEGGKVTKTPLYTAAQPAPVQEPVAHCEAGPEFCQQCHLEDRSLALAAAVRYVQNNTPKLVSDEICMALTIPPNVATPLDETASLAAPAPEERKRPWFDRCRMRRLKQ